MMEQATQKESYPKDSWYNAAPSGIEPWDWSKLEASRVYKVANTAESEAENMLRTKPLVSLSVSQVKVLTGRHLTLEKLRGKTPYLVRAVYFNKGTGQFEVYYKGKKLWIEHGSLGHSSVPMKRQALIVLLKARPDEVFVTCSMDE